jgi:hypothetical protein
MFDVSIRVGGTMITVSCDEHMGAARAWAASDVRNPKEALEPCPGRSTDGRKLAAERLQ